MAWEQDRVPVIRRQDSPGGEEKTVLLTAQMDHAGQAGKFGLGEHLSLA